MSFTAGWDPINKTGYVTLIDEEKRSQAIDDLKLEEFSMLLNLLNGEQQVFLDNNKWIIVGWNPNNQMAAQ